MNLAQNKTERPQLQELTGATKRRSRKKAVVIPIAKAVTQSDLRHRREAAPAQKQAEILVARQEKDTALPMEERSLAGVLLEGIAVLEEDPVAGILSEADSMLGLLCSLLNGCGDGLGDLELSYIDDVLFTLRGRLNVAAQLNRRSKREPAAEGSRS